MMTEYAETLLDAERRGRLLVLRFPPEGSGIWHITAAPDPDGIALLAAARWVCRLGGRAEVTLAGSRSRWKEWGHIAESIRLQGIPLRHSISGQSALMLSADGGLLPIALPAAEETWGAGLTESRPLAVPAGPDFPARSCRACRDIDRKAIELYGVPGLCLMENAAAAAVTVGQSLLAGRSGGILAAAGGGNNGGDGFAMARGFTALGIPAEIALLKPPEKLTGDALENYRLCQKTGIPVHCAAGTPEILGRLAAGKALVIDALLGTGFSGPLSPAFRTAIEAVNNSGVPVLAVDIPSGLDGDTGAVPETAVRAAACITFAAVKTGLLRKRGPEHCGRLYLGDIGAPLAALA